MGFFHAELVLSKKRDDLWFFSINLIYIVLRKESVFEVRRLFL